MGVIDKGAGELQPICNDCGIALCWRISEEDYAELRGFWDSWRCEVCDPDAPGSLKRWKSAQEQTDCFPSRVGGMG